MLAYTGIETVSNLAEEARDYGQTIPRGIGGRGGRGGGDLRLPARGGAVGDAGGGRRDRAGAAQGGGRLRRRPDPGRGREHGPRARSSTRPRSTWACWPPRILFIATNAGHDRRVAADLLDGPVPPAARPACASCTRATARRTWRSCVFGAIACLTIVPGPGRVPRQDLRLRGDAVVHRSPTWRWCVLRVNQPDVERPYRIPGNVRWRGAAAARCCRSSAGWPPASRSWCCRC